MTLVQDKSDLLSTFTRHAPQPADGPAWLRRLRRAGLDRFQAFGFPAGRDEEWRFTNLNPITRTRFDLAAPPPDLAADAIAPFTFGRRASAELVFVNGQFAPSLSRLTDLPEGVTALRLPDALRQAPDLVERHLARYADIQANPFVALNTGFLGEGAVVHVRRGVAVDRPIHLLFLSVPGPRPAIAHVRNLIVVDDGAIASIVETYASAGPGVFFTTAVTEVAAGPDARIDHCKLQQENHEALHVAATHVRLDRAADFVSHSATIGGRLTRNDLVVTLDGEFAHATLNGLVILSGQQHCDNHTLLRHEKPNCPSHELYKHVLGDHATGVFKGKIFVQKDAQKTDSKQTSKSLLLSDDAYMNSQPALEIYADDVKCTHGSTTGPLDEDMMFYLRTRGVPRDTARHLLTYAFAADITRRIRVAPVRERLEDFMAAQHNLPQDLRITDLGSHDEAAR